MLENTTGDLVPDFVLQFELIVGELLVTTFLGLVYFLLVRPFAVGLLVYLRRMVLLCPLENNAVNAAAACYTQMLTTWPPAEKPGKGSTLNRSSCPPNDPIGQPTNVIRAELN